MSDPPAERRAVLTPIELGMQRRLFGGCSRRVPAASDSAMWRVLLALRASTEFDCFRMWLVGSRLEPGRHESDIDILLSPQRRLALSDPTIERALWFCRHYGLYA